MRAITVNEMSCTIAKFLEVVRHQKTNVVGCEWAVANNLLMGTQVMTKYVPHLCSGLCHASPAKQHAAEEIGNTYGVPACLHKRCGCMRRKPYGIPDIHPEHP